MQACEMHAHETYVIGSWGDFSLYAKLRFVGFAPNPSRSVAVAVVAV
jgi:hypothetical protein